MTQMSALPPGPLPDPLPPITQLAPATGKAMTLVGGVEQSLVDMLTHAGTPGPQTTEFWAILVAPVVAFLAAVLASSAAVSALAPPSIIDAVAPLAVGAVTAACATFAARAYVAARTALKQDVLARIPGLIKLP